MKASAIVRIVLYSLLFLILLGILLGGIAIGEFIYNNHSWVSSETTTQEWSIQADEFSNLDFNWAAGSIKIVTADTDEITIKEIKDSNNPYVLSIVMEEDGLKVSYSSGPSISIGSFTGKDLVVTVPKDWACDELTIDGAALNIDISDLTVESMDLDGAATKLTFNGSLGELEYDGAAANLNLNCINCPDSIRIDGAACKLDLTIPTGSGYRVDADGLAIDFESNCAYEMYDDTYVYGNTHCHVGVSGTGCQITVDEAQ